MIYDYRKLQGEEINALKETIEEHREYDKLDLLISITLQKLGIPSSEFLSRSSEHKKEEEPILVQKMDESLKFCDGDKCQVNVFSSC